MSDVPADTAQVTELKVSAHLMRLDPGVFCIFNSPGTAAPDERTGLPGVRISLAPAPGALNGIVTLTGFNGDGWMAGPDAAALVRVNGGPAQVLVTVYQSRDARQEAPKIQVLRLTGAQAAAVAPAPSVPMEVAAHIYGLGDVTGRLGQWMGEPGSKRWIEGFALQPANGVPASDIEYQAVLGRGWLSPWAEGGQFCGSRGMSLPILGLRARLRGPSAATHLLTVAASFVDGSKAGPVGDGEACEAPSLAALEAFQVTLEPKTQAAPPRRRAAEKPAPAPPKPAGKPAPKRR